MKSTHKKRNVHGQRKKLTSPNAKNTNMLVSLRQVKKYYFVALGDAKVPNASSFASQWNIGLKECTQIGHHPETNFVYLFPSNM